MAPTIGGEILVLLLLAAAQCFAQEILRSPESTTVFLNQPAVFTCETRGGITSWRINETQRELLLPDILRDLVISESTTSEGVLVETLTIPARAQYNRTRVQCLSVIIVVSLVESDNATLTIQGPLSAVGDLKSKGNASSVTIWWSAPFSLDVTGVDPDIWYSVLIYNVTDENNPTAILCTDCINITETHYTFTPDYPSPCHVYNFSVIPNGAGQGESSPNITDEKHFQEIKFPEVKVEALDNDDLYRKVEFRYYEQVHTVSVYIDNNGTNGTVFTLPADGEYNATVKDPMACGTGKTKNFTTYDVQEPRAESNDGGKIVVNGTLIGNSPAQGCFVVIQCNFTTQITFIALKRNGTNQNLSMAISMPASNYTVYVHDLEKEGIPNIHPANLVPSSVDITLGEEKYKAPNVENLKNASISRNGSSLEVTCTPDEQSASCVLVYRAHGNSMLNYAETFPVTVDLDPDMNYTFALFRRLNNNYTDERPFLSMFVQEKEDSLQPGTPERAENTSSIVAVTVGVLVAVIIFLVVVTVSIMAIMLRKKKSGKLVESVDRNVTASSYAPVMDRIAEDGGMKKEDSKEEESKYAVVVTSVSVPRPSLPDVSKVQYQEIDIKTTHKMARSQYAEMGPLPAGRPKPLEMDTKTQCPYVTILPHATTPVNENSNRGPPTVQSVMSLLWGVAGRWKEVAEGLEFDEDMIDEIDTNNDMNEGCLQVCVEIWVNRLQPSWEKLSRALRDLEEVELARQAGNKEPQEQRQVPSRQTSDSSSSGVVADTSSESSDFSGEMVPGVEQTPATNDGNNEDGSRGGKKMMPDDCSSGEQDARSVFFAYPALHEEGLTVSGSGEEDEDTKCDVGTNATVESGEGEKVTVVSGTDLFDFPYKPSLEEFHVLPPLEGNDDPDFAQDPVSTQGPDDDYHSGSINSGRQKSAATMDTAKVVGRDVIAGGVVVVPRQCTGFSGMTGPEETDTARGPFRPPVNQSQQSAGRFGLNNAVYPSLSLLTGAGMLVIGGPYTRRDIFKTVPRDEPSPEPLENQPQPSPEETDSSQPLPPEPTPPQSQHVEVSPVQLQENNPPSLPPPPPPLQSSEIEEKVSTPLKKRQYLDPPGNYREKIMKWLHTGVSCGFRGPDLLVKLFTGGSQLG